MVLLEIYTPCLWMKVMMYKLIPQFQISFSKKNLQAEKEIYEKTRTCTECVCRHHGQTKIGFPTLSSLSCIQNVLWPSCPWWSSTALCPPSGCLGPATYLFSMQDCLKNILKQNFIICTCTWLWLHCLVIPSDYDHGIGGCLWPLWLDRGLSVCLECSTMGWNT